MSDIEFEARQSKKLFIIGVFSALIFEVLFSVFAIVFLINISINAFYTFDEYTVYALCSVISGVFAVVILIILIYLIYVYIYQKDIYTYNKMYRKKGKKIVFEIPYKNIANIKYGFDSIFFFLKEPIVKINGKKGPRNFYAHYSKYDIDRIIHIINSEYIR